MSASDSVMAFICPLIFVLSWPALPSVFVFDYLFVNLGIINYLAVKMASGTLGLSAQYSAKHLLLHRIRDAKLC